MTAAVRALGLAFGQCHIRDIGSHSVAGNGARAPATRAGFSSYGAWDHRQQGIERQQQCQRQPGDTLAASECPESSAERLHEQRCRSWSGQDSTCWIGAFIPCPQRRCRSFRSRN